MYKLIGISFFYAIYNFNLFIYIRVESDVDKKEIPVIKKRVKYIKEKFFFFKKR